MARRIRLRSQTWHALDRLSWETQRPINDIAEEALGDLLRKHRRPRTLREALREATRRRPRTLREALRDAARRHPARDDGARRRG